MSDLTPNPAPAPQSPPAPVGSEANGGGIEARKATGVFAPTGGGPAELLAPAPQQGVPDPLLAPAPQPPGSAPAPLPPGQAPAPPAPGTAPAPPVTDQGVQAPAPPVAPVPPVTQQPILPKDDPKRMEYHQSQADLAKNALATIQNDPAYKLAQNIRGNPELLNVVEEHSRTQGIGGIKPPVKPERPAMPANYSAADVYDPETESSKYATAFGKYQEDMATFNENLGVYNQAVDRQRSEANQLATMRNGLIMDANMPQEQADELMTMLNSDIARDPRMLAQFYTILKGASPQIDDQQQRLQAIQDRNGVLQTPPPVNVMPGESEVPGDWESDFKAGVRAMAKTPAL